MFFSSALRKSYNKNSNNSNNSSSNNNNNNSSNINNSNSNNGNNNSNNNHGNNNSNNKAAGWLNSLSALLGSRNDNKKYCNVFTTRWRKRGLKTWGGGTNVESKAAEWRHTIFWQLFWPWKKSCAISTRSFLLSLFLTFYLNGTNLLLLLLLLLRRRQKVSTSKSDHHRSLLPLSKSMGHYWSCEKLRSMLLSQNSFCRKCRKSGRGINKNMANQSL